MQLRLAALNFVQILTQTLQQFQEIGDLVISGILSHNICMQCDDPVASIEEEAERASAFALDIMDV